MEKLLYVCEICDAILDESHCKARCPNCGRALDCSDLPLFQAQGMIEENAAGEKVFIPRPSPAHAGHKKAAVDLGAHEKTH